MNGRRPTSPDNRTRAVPVLGNLALANRRYRESKFRGRGRGDQVPPHARHRAEVEHPPPKKNACCESSDLTLRGLGRRLKQHSGEISPPIPEIAANRTCSTPRRESLRIRAFAPCFQSLRGPREPAFSEFPVGKVKM